MTLFFENLKRPSATNQTNETQLWSLVTGPKTKSFTYQKRVAKKKAIKFWCVQHRAQQRAVPAAQSVSPTGTHTFGGSFSCSLFFLNQGLRSQDLLKLRSNLKRLDISVEKICRRHFGSRYIVDRKIVNSHQVPRKGTYGEGLFLRFKAVGPDMISFLHRHILLGFSLDRACANIALAQPSCPILLSRYQWLLPWDSFSQNPENVHKEDSMKIFMDLIRYMEKNYLKYVGLFSHNTRPNASGYTVNLHNRDLYMTMRKNYTFPEMLGAPLFFHKIEGIHRKFLLRL